MSDAPTNHIVWSEIPVTDMERSIAFYEAVCQTKMQPYDEGPNPMASFGDMLQPGVSGHLYPGKPAGDGSGPTIHIAVPDKLENAMTRVTAAGGTVISEPIPIPVGRFFYAHDLDGNSIGFFEAS